MSPVNCTDPAFKQYSNSVSVKCIVVQCQQYMCELCTMLFASTYRNAPPLSSIPDSVEVLKWEIDTLKKKVRFKKKIKTYTVVSRG